MSSLLAFPVRSPEQPGLEIRVNFGIFAGREATQRRSRSSATLSARDRDAGISSENRYEIGPRARRRCTRCGSRFRPRRCRADDFQIGELADGW
jgi:hypothetical protein